MAQTAHVFNRLDAHVLEEVRVCRINAAGEHEILPDQDAVAVTQIVERVFGVIAAAPDAQHVHVGVGGALDQPLQVAFSDARGKRIGGDPVGALGEQAHAVDVKRKFLAPRVGLLAQLDRAQADLVAALVENGLAVFQRDFDFVQRLRTIAVRPPELRMGDFDRGSREVGLALHQIEQLLLGLESFASGACHRYRSHDLGLQVIA